MPRACLTDMAWPFCKSPLGGGTHEQLDTQSAGDQGLNLGEPAVFPQIVQGFQHKISLHLIDIAGHLADHGGEIHARLGQLLDLQGHQHLSRRGGAGVEDVHIGVGVVLQPEAPRLGRRVVGAGEQGGKGDHVQVVGTAVKSLQILDGGGTGGLGAVALSFIRQSRAPWSKEASSTTICSPTRMVSGTLTKQSSRSWAGVKSQQLSTMILKLIAGTLLYHNEN